MPVQSCRSDGKPGYRWGGSGKCYTYPAGDDRARREAKRKAIIQGVAVERRSGKASLTGEQFTALVEQAGLEAEQRYLPDLRRGWDAALRAAGNTAAERFALTAQAEWQPPPEGWTLTSAALAAIASELNQDIETVRAAIVEHVGSAPLATIEISFTVKHPLASSLLARVSQRTGAALGEASQFLLRQIVASAYEEGLSVPQTSQRIQDEMRIGAKWQADMLARTDLAALNNGASTAAAQLADMSFKTWLATLDDRTRPEHVDAHGQTVEMAAPFIVGGEEAQFPADPSLSDAMACNCRCSVSYGETLEESVGLLADASVIIMDPMASARKRSRRAARRRAQRVPVNDGASTASTMSMADPAKGEATEALLADARPIGFVGVAAIEGKLSDDSSVAPRILLPDALSWEEMPRPFMAQTVTAEGHDGAAVAGRIDEFKRRRLLGRMREIGFAGELTTPYGIDEIAPMIEDQTMRYVSADLGAAEWTVVLRDTLEQVAEEELDMTQLAEGAYALGLTAGKIKAVTLVPTQAIEGALVALTAAADAFGFAVESYRDWTHDENGDHFEEMARIIFPIDGNLSLFEGEALVASPAPARPPRDWFETPEPPGKMPLTVLEDGRVYGHLATWDSCHVGFLPSCVPPPRSASNYAYFHVCELDTEEGDTLTVGKLMFSPTDGGHADRRLTAQKAAQYYDRTGMVAAYLRVEDGAHGIWACGALNPRLSDEDRAEMRRELRLNPPSGDWRPINSQYELICGLAVAVPGYPTPRQGGATVTVVASADGLEMSEAIIASSGWFEPDESALAALEHQGLLDDEAQAERRMRTLAARAQGMDALVALVD